MMRAMPEAITLSHWSQESGRAEGGGSPGCRRQKETQSMFCLSVRPVHEDLYGVGVGCRDTVSDESLAVGTAANGEAQYTEPCSSFSG